MKTNIYSTIGICFLILIGSVTHAQETKAKNTSTKPNTSSAKVKAKTSSPAATATSGAVKKSVPAASSQSKASTVAHPDKGTQNTKALAPKASKKVQSVNAQPAKELPRGNAAPKSKKVGHPTQNAKTSPGAPAHKNADAHRGHNHSGQQHAKQSHVSHGTKNTTKPKPNNGNAYGKNKESVKGKNFGQQRANEAKSKKKKNKEN